MGILTVLLLRNKFNFIILFKIQFNLIITIILYLGFLVISSSIVAYNEIGDRLLSPIFIPITILLTILISQVLEFVISTFPKVLKIVVLSSLVFIWYVAWLSYFFHFNIPAYKSNMPRELGYNSYWWIHNQTIMKLQEKNFNTNYSIYSNDPYALYILTNCKAENTPTYNGLFNGLLSHKKVNELSELKGIWPKQNPAYLVWFKRNSYLETSMFKLEEINLIAKLTPIIQLDDGTIYLMNKK